ncbi:MAG: 16S rRNA (adenine(1518)-N(6)/adenine(1519)-N(6))-dimethyltransferase RsmA [Nitrospirota bacterium]
MTSEKDSFHYPKKSLGQHFLSDPNIIRKIITLAAISPGDLVVEIGPGRGVLTEALLKAGAKLLAIEIDQDLCAVLKERFSSEPNFTLSLGDACRYPYEKINSPFQVVANLPYQISTPILFRLLEEQGRLTKMTLMVQKEVAERLVAKPNSKEYGVLSVLLQRFADIKIGFRVSRSCFRPMPNVDSSVIQVTPILKAKVTILNELFFAKVVRGAFSHRRKHLANTLCDAGFPRLACLNAFAKIGMDARRRAETLSIDEFAHLANALFIENKTNSV